MFLCWFVYIFNKPRLWRFKGFNAFENSLTSIKARSHLSRLYSEPNENLIRDSLVLYERFLYKLHSHDGFCITMAHLTNGKRKIANCWYMRDMYSRKIQHPSKKFSGVVLTESIVAHVYTPIFLICYRKTQKYTLLRWVH